MPPKKKNPKTTGNGLSGRPSTPQYMWLLKYDTGGGYHELVRHTVLYSTKEKAIAGVPHLMDTYAVCGDDWKNGLEGFGHEDEDDYLQFDYFGDGFGDNDGVVLTNKDSDAENPITVSLERMRVDPSEPEKVEETATAADFVF